MFLRSSWACGQNSKYKVLVITETRVRKPVWGEKLSSDWHWVLEKYTLSAHKLGSAAKLWWFLKHKFQGRAWSTRIASKIGLWDRRSLDFCIKFCERNERGHSLLAGVPKSTGSFHLKEPASRSCLLSDQSSLGCSLEEPNSSTIWVSDK